MANAGLALCYADFGSQAAFAEAIGVTPQALTKWNNHGVPPGRVPQIVKLMRRRGVEITYHDLRPDLYPREVSRVHAGVSP